MTAPARTDPYTQLQVSDFLYLEAALIDERRFDEWLDLYTDNALYWIPAKEGTPDPRSEVSLAYDGRARLRERVLRLESGFAHAQDPPSRTSHLIGNIRVMGETDGALRVASSFLVTEVRRGRQNMHAGMAEHDLIEEGESWRIRRKVTHLATCDLPLGNLTFLL